MSASADKILRDLLSLPESERVRIATEVLASLDGPPDADWDQAWLAELEKRRQAGAARGEATSDWTQVRARILGRMAGG